MSLKMSNPYRPPSSFFKKENGGLEIADFKTAVWLEFGHTSTQPSIQRLFICRFRWRPKFSKGLLNKADLSLCRPRAIPPLSAILLRFSSQQVSGGVCNIAQITPCGTVAAEQFPHQAAKKIGLCKFTPAMQFLHNLLGELPQDTNILAFREPA